MAKKVRPWKVIERGERGARNERHCGYARSPQQRITQLREILYCVRKRRADGFYLIASKMPCAMPTERSGNE